MGERDGLLSSIAATIADYREGDLTAPSPSHVERWVNQFNTGVQLGILREMDHVLKQTYFSRVKTGMFLRGLFKSEKLVGADPCSFWKSVKFLDIQGGGASQKEMLALFGAILQKECGIKIEECGIDPTTFIYLDDAIFSGGRVCSDLGDWIKQHAPDKATIHVIVAATHRSSYYNRNKLGEAIRASGKTIIVNWWCSVELEDRRAYTTTSDVLRPIAVPDDEDVKAYVAAMHYKPNLRTAGNVGGHGIFSSDAGRQLIELEFLKAGVRIRQMCPNLNQYQRPLGNMILETLGFGSLIVTFRNCPNNAPLALWVGDPWYPLFPRTTNSDTSLRKMMAMLAREDF